MTSNFQLLLLITTILSIFGFATASFPENSLPISVTALHDVPTSVFTGGVSDSLSHMQELKRIKIAGKDYYAVTGRERIFFIRPEDFSPNAASQVQHTKAHSWKTNERAKKLCKLKGQSEENCENYIRVLEQMDGNGNKLIVCATNSYDPQCLYLSAITKSNDLILNDDGEVFSGAEKCAFGPDQTGVSLYTGTSLYSATASDFSGRSYAITRSLGREKQLRTPKFDPKFLDEPIFVKMIDDGERVLVFMNEMVHTENGDVRMVAYVAQVCKNDVGGTHVLVRQWTKFEKTRLNCSLKGFYFDQLSDVTDPVDVRVDADSDDTVKTIYATFTTPDYSVPGSAVCAFTVGSIHDALSGRFREERGSGAPKSSSAPSGSKHPGKCPNVRYTESELLFLKSHPLLEDQARGALLTTYVGERWTAVAVDSAAGPGRNWTVFFVGTANGQVLRYLAPTGGLKNSILLNKQDVYDEKSCGNATRGDKSVTRIVVDPEQDQTLVAFKHCVVSIPLRSCSIHKCKKSCISSADPYCGWNGTFCVGYVTAPSANIEQYVFSEATNPSSYVDEQCSQVEGFPFPVEKSENTARSAFASEENGKSRVKNNGTAYVVTNGSFVDRRAGEDGQALQPSGVAEVDEDGYMGWQIVIAIVAGTAVLSFSIGFVASKMCCSPAANKNVEEQGIDISKTSMSNSDTLCKRFIANISPKRSRKESLKPRTLNHIQSTLDDDLQGKTLVTKDHSKQDECVNRTDDNLKKAQTLQTRERNHQTRLNSGSSASQVTITESFASYNSKRRCSNQQPTSSASSMSKVRPSYATAPRGRHYSGGRTSDVTDHANVPMLRAERTHSRVSSRHSTPAPTLPTTPTSLKDNVFPFDNVIENTEHVLIGIKEVIEQQQRRSAEMEPVMEEYEEIRPRHDASGSGRGSSPLNSVQTEDHDKLSTLSRTRPENLKIVVPTKGRKRINSDPTSPTTPQPPLPPPSSHKPIGRSTSMRSQHAMSVPNYQPRKRSESFSNHQMRPRVAKPTHVGMHQMVQNGFRPQAQPNVYATLPTNPQPSNGAHPPVENFHRQPPYDAYAQPHGRYPIFEQQDHPAMNLSDRYSSLPLRSQAHSSTKKQYPAQYPRHNGQPSRRNSAAPQIPPGFYQQMPNPTNFDSQRGQRPRFVPGAMAPGYPGTLPEQDVV